MTQGPRPPLRGSQTDPHSFSGRDLHWLVDTQAHARPDKTFLIWEPFVGESASWTFARFADEVERYASGLNAIGVVPGDFIVLHMDNCPEYLFAWFACATAGAVAVTTNTRSTEEELAYFISHCRAKAAITQPRHAALVQKAERGQLNWIACIESDWGQPEPQLRPRNIIRFEDLRADPSQAPRRQADPLARGSVQYTSGTTSRPKGVVWTHANALWGGRVTASHLRLRPSDTTLIALPLFHTNALVYSMMSTMWAGGTIVLTPRFSASRFWDLIVRHHCTWGSLTAFPIRALLQRPAPIKHSLKLLGVGAGDFHAPADRWGTRSLGWFGMTETVTQCIMSDPDMPGAPMSMGTCVPEYEIAIRRDDGSVAAPGETGKLWIRGRRGISLFLEYLNDPDATAAAFDADGWFDTGDLVTSRGDAEIFFVSRAKDMLKVGGENVAALEIESVVLRVPGITEVAVVGKPDEMRDEVPVCFVVAKNPGPALELEILARCNKDLADFKRPREIIFIDALPRGLMDKVLKRELKDRLVERSRSVDAVR